jgi:hypothetical protein
METPIEAPKDKSLKSVAVDIKGKKYVLVSDRVLYFNENYPDGFIVTEILSAPESKNIVMQAVVYPESTKPRRFIGHSQATIGDGYINKTSALENAETSAVGRALALMGIGVIDSIASVDEINKASHPVANKPVHSQNATPTTKPDLYSVAGRFISTSTDIQKLTTFVESVKKQAFTEDQKESLLIAIDDRKKELAHSKEPQDDITYRSTLEENIEYPEGPTDKPPF